MRRVFLGLAALVLGCAAFASPCAAADITVLAVYKGIGIIGVEGELKQQDGEVFAERVSRFARAAIFFNSPGGALIAGLQMGQIIRLRHYITFSADDWLCASACAIAWLAGTPRVMEPGSRIGFHVAYDRDTHQPVGAGNALIGAYLNRLGLSDAAIVYIETSSPDDITFLTREAARRYGIEVRFIPPSGRRGSRATPDEPDTSREVRRSTHADPELLPSLVSPMAPAVPAGSLDDQATAYVQDYFAHWSEGNSQALEFFDAAYAPKVIFYGETIDRPLLMQKKQDYVARWPIRVYSARPSSLRSFCNAANRICVVTGIVDWDCRNPQRGAHSTGAANFSLTVALSGDDRSIMAESGSVISRTTE